MWLSPWRLALNTMTLGFDLRAEASPSQLTDEVVKSSAIEGEHLDPEAFDDGNGRIARALADMVLSRPDDTQDRLYGVSSGIEGRPVWPQSAARRRARGSKAEDGSHDSITAQSIVARMSSVAIEPLAIEPSPHRPVRLLYVPTLGEDD